MTETPTPAELPRLQALERYELADVPHDPALDDIARLAAQLCNAPAAAITLIEQDIVLLPGRFGLDIDTAPRNSLPCETTIAADGIYQIPDARRDPNYSPGGIPVGDRRYRFYAGAPILTPQSIAIGCLSVFDTAARQALRRSARLPRVPSRTWSPRASSSCSGPRNGSRRPWPQRAQTALTVERNFVSAVLDTVGALVVVFDTAGRIVRFNRAAKSSPAMSPRNSLASTPGSASSPKATSPTTFRVREVEHPSTPDCPRLDDFSIQDLPHTRIEQHPDVKLTRWVQGNDLKVLLNIAAKHLL